MILESHNELIEPHGARLSSGVSWTHSERCRWYNDRLYDERSVEVDWLFPLFSFGTYNPGHKLLEVISHVRSG